MAKSKVKTSQFENYREGVQHFTQGAGISLGLVWILELFIGNVAFSVFGIGTSMDGFAAAFLLATILGGMKMGVLYLIHLSRKN